jgi:hypothetical protein
MSSQRLLSLSRQLATGLVLLLLLVSFCFKPAVAQSVLQKGEIYKLTNQVDLNRHNQPVWSRAKLGDPLTPQDSIRTGANSRAELIFNEGTLVRIAAGTIFRFPPGKRNFELRSGAALVMIRPGQGQSNISIPDATVVSQGTALFLQHDSNRNASLIGVLTNSPSGPVRVSSVDGKVTVELQAGQFISIVNGVMGLVEHFVLPMFYETIQMAYGLGTGQENLIAREPPAVQETINLVRAEALAPLTNQIAWLNGFCHINVNPNELSPLLQWLGLGTPGEQISLKLPESDLFVTPIRSLTGLLWLGNYCQVNQNTPHSQPN